MYWVYTLLADVKAVYDRVDRKSGKNVRRSVRKGMKDAIEEIYMEMECVVKVEDRMVVRL